MKQAAAALLGAGLTAASCCAAGLWLMDRLRLSEFLRRPERLPLAFPLGAAVLHLLIFAILCAQIAYWPVLAAALLLPIVLCWRSGAWRSPGFDLTAVPRTLRWLAAAAGGLFLAIYFVYAWAPEHSPDGSAYHLGLVARELREHGFSKITTTFYAMLGQGVELIYLPAFAIGRHSAAALVHLCFGVSLAFAMLAFGRRLGFPWVGAAAAALTFFSPVFGITTSIAYIDAAAAAIVFACFYFLEIWDSERAVAAHPGKLLIAAGALAGYAYATKFTAFTIGVYALLFTAFKARKLKPLLLLIAPALLMAGPWIARNWILYANPTAPFGNAIFRNPYVHVLSEQDYSANLRRYLVEDRTELPWEVTFRGHKTQGIVGPVFLLLPLGLFALRRRIGRHVWLAGLFLLSTYPANIGTRFLIPSLPFFSFVLALAIGEAPLILAGLIAIHAALSWPTVLKTYAAEHIWRMDHFPWEAALRIQPPAQYLEKRLEPGYAAAQMLNDHVPRGEKVFTQGGVPDAYTDSEVMVSFQSAFNETVADIFHMGWQIGRQPIRTNVYRFPERSARRWRIEQTGQSARGEQWNVHELRFFHKGTEIPRRPEWRLQAWPNSWEVQMAFDNSKGTRWRSWETIAPGMYIEVDFGRDETVDEIRVDGSSDSPSVHMEPLTQSASGEWTRIEAALEGLDVLPVPDRRRIATYEMHQRGVRYILLFDTDYGASDVLEDPEGWGLTQIAASPGARLYKTIW